ncbi:MAG: aa3-type cytochrome c oxidase subunit IV [Alphaproteobacteria bacterium]
MAAQPDLKEHQQTWHGVVKLMAALAAVSLITLGLMAIFLV